MGKTNRPMKIVVHPDFLEHSAIRDLINKGNEIIPFPSDLVDADIIIGPNAWRVTSELEFLIPMAIKAARKVKYGNKRSEKKRRLYY